MIRQDFLSVLHLAITAELPRMNDENGKPTAYGVDVFTIFDGCALDSQRRICTRQQFASFARYQAQQFNGQMDPGAVLELEAISKRVDLIDGRICVKCGASIVDGVNGCQMMGSRCSACDGWPVYHVTTTKRARRDDGAADYWENRILARQEAAYNA